MSCLKMRIRTDFISVYCIKVFKGEKMFGGPAEMKQIYLLLKESII